MAYRRVDRARVMTLVENSINPFLKKRENVRWQQPEEGLLLAEHGWAALIETTANGKKHTLLLDAGLSETTLLHNMDRLKLDMMAIEAIVVSHGHGDHTGALIGLLQRLGRPLPVFVHPAAFRERWTIPPDGPRRGPSGPNREKWEAAGAQIVATEGPHEVFPGCVVSGGIPRHTDFEHPPRHYFYRENDAFHPETLPDDQAVVVIVEGKGLLVVSGCAHAGIVNTVRYAQAITGEPRVWAVAGGFHLAGASQEVIAATVSGLQAAGPTLVAPGHCTGFDAQRAIAAAMPAQFVLNVVGTVISTHMEGEER